MTPEEIDLYRKIQHRKGEWRFGDIGLDIELGRFVVTWSVTGYTGMEVHWEGDGQPGALQKDDPDLLWLPPVWSNDGRCLIGMLGGNGELAWVENGEYAVFVYDEDTCDQKSFYGATPDEALLRAIREQEADHE